jgi:hypothetical protein
LQPVVLHIIVRTATPKVPTETCCESKILKPTSAFLFTDTLMETIGVNPNIY